MIGQTISHYKILEKLGEGGMGVVYKAQDISLDRTVALKLLPSRTVVTDDDKARFSNEARAAAKLSHPHIATVHEFGEADGHTFLAMEFVEGKSLRKKIQQSPLPVTEVLRIASEAANGLAAAHEHGIIHRDAKSENIMLTPDGSAKIMDFGLAQVRGQSRLWKSRETVGTVSYMSPEQARGEHLDERTDIWSLGVVIYEMVTGRLPFPGEYESAVLYLIIHEHPQPIKTIRDDVPTKLQEIVSKCLEKDCDRRYGKVTELLTDVNALQKQLETGIEERQEKPVEEKRFETERRPVTVLHAAIVPSGTEELDPEALTAGLDECIDGLLGIIEKYDGMADRVVGDKLMAVFGAPIAHENDPERAIRCAHVMMSYVLRVTALGMSQASTALQLKIAIHTGVVIAGNVGAAGKSGYSVVGDAINVVAGIVDVVATGKISLSADAYKLVAGMVEVEEPRMIAVRGKTREMKVFDFRSLKLGTEPGRRMVGGGAFVGRTEEIKAFEEAIERVQKNTEVRLFIRGEAGVGKTRLKNELVARAERRHMSIIEGKCSSFESNTPEFTLKRS